MKDLSQLYFITFKFLEMKNVLVLICTVFMSLSAMGNNTLPQKDLNSKPNREEIKLKNIISLQEIVQILILEREENFSEDEIKKGTLYSCSPCEIITVSCCGNSVSAQWCDDCYHGSKGAFSSSICSQLCNQQ